MVTASLTSTRRSHWSRDEDRTSTVACCVTCWSMALTLVGNCFQRAVCLGHPPMATVCTSRGGVRCIAQPSSVVCAPAATVPAPTTPPVVTPAPTRLHDQRVLQELRCCSCCRLFLSAGDPGFQWQFDRDNDGLVANRRLSLPGSQIPRLLFATFLVLIGMASAWHLRRRGSSTACWSVVTTTTLDTVTAPHMTQGKH
jgi:hypothetical protein